jgi:hypothetical protein
MRRLAVGRVEVDAGGRDADGDERLGEPRQPGMRRGDAMLQARTARFLAGADKRSGFILAVIERQDSLFGHGATTTGCYG